MATIAATAAAQHSSGTPTTIYDLPVDFLRLLFHALPDRDLCAVACVNKAWRALSSTPEFWKPRVQRRWAYGTAKWKELEAASAWKAVYRERHKVWATAGISTLCA